MAGHVILIDYPPHSADGEGMAKHIVLVGYTRHDSSCGWFGRAFVWRHGDHMGPMGLTDLGLSHAICRDDHMQQW